MKQRFNIRYVCAALIGMTGGAASAQSFVNWENHPIHPLEMTPDGLTLLAANIADNRVEIFSLAGASPVLSGAVQVGLDPVSVRARTNDEIWVVNHISDSVSIVSLSTRRVVRTLRTADEPFDVVFAGAPQRAFVSCSQANKVLVFDPANLSAAPVEIDIDAEDPRAMAVSPDGSTVYVAIFESGNGSTVLGGGGDETNGGMRLAFPPNVVNEAAGPYGGVNPPPNSGAAFFPAILPANANPPAVGLIVKKDELGRWMDDNNHDWTALVSGPQAGLSGRPVGWDLPDRDIAVIDADTLNLSYVSRCMNIVMSIAVNPVSGDVTAVGTDGINEVRFEPNVNGRFLRVNMASWTPDSPSDPTVVDLNPHLTYANPTIPQPQRDESIGDPRGIAWNPAGTKAYITGLGSNNVIVVDPAGDRAGISSTIAVGEGPIGVTVDQPRNRLYVLNRFEDSLSIVNLTTETETGRVALHDPTPEDVKTGRKHLYNTHQTSGLGHTSCGSCHVDSRMDRLGWDLGDPGGSFVSITGQNLGAGVPGLSPPTANPPFLDFHPMKGPMTTQTLQDIIGNEPHHWRGDRDGIEEFNPAFTGLLGDDVELTPQEMQEFEDFLATITFPPNPFRNFDNTLPTSLPLEGHFTTGRFAAAGQPLPNGNAQSGMTLYRSTARRLDANAFACVTCHTLPTGMGTNTTFNGSQYVALPPGPRGEAHHQLVSVDGSTNRTIKTPQLRNVYEKTGFNTTQLSNRAGFGYLHDGSVDSIERFIAEPVFTVNSDQEVANLVAFMLAFSGSELPTGSPTNIFIPPGSPSQDTHAAVGWQTTLRDATSPDVGQFTLIANMLTQADAGKVGVVVKGRVGGVARGYRYNNGAGTFQSDRAAQALTATQLRDGAGPGSELTYTVVPLQTQTRIGIDRDEDGFFDRDEIEACSDPADAASVPNPNGLPGDADGDFDVDLTDLATLLANFGTASGATRAQGDFDADGDVDLSDLAQLLTNFGRTCG